MKDQKWLFTALKCWFAQIYYKHLLPTFYNKVEKTYLYLQIERNEKRISFNRAKKKKSSLTSWSDSTYFAAMIRSNLKLFNNWNNAKKKISLSLNHELFTYKYGTHIPHFVISLCSAMLSVNTAFTQPISKR